MEGLPERNELNLLADLVYSFFNGLLLFILTYPLFLGLLTLWYVVGFTHGIIVAINWPIVLLAFITLSAIVGVANSLTAKYLWSYRCKNSGKAWLTQGLIIVVMTQLLLIPFPTVLSVITALAQWTQPVFLVLIFTDYCILFGIIGRTTARKYIEPLPYRYRSINKDKIPSFAGTRAKCPWCHVSHKYRDYEIDDDSTVKCLTCSRPFYIDPIGSLMEKIGVKRDVDTRIDL
ncbi:MAG: hypothetical protein ACFFDV_06935 [Candidatus Thorarchaeota archaeon]